MRDIPIKQHKSLDNLLQDYGIATLCILAALLLSSLLWSVIHGTPLIFLIAAVALSAWRGGLGPGVFTAAFGIILIDYFLLEPRYNIFSDPVEILQFAIFVLVAFLISWLEERRRQSEISLNALKEELEVIINTVADGITAQDIHGQGVFANPAAAQILWNSTPEFVINTPVDELRRQVEMLDDHGNFLPFTEMPRAKVFATGKPSELVFGHRYKNTGEIRWLSLKSAPVFDENGNVRLAVNVFRDITGQRQMETLKRESEERLRKVLDNLATFVGVTTPDGILIEANQAALTTVGLPPDEIIGKPIDQLYVWNYSEAVQQQIREGVTRAASGETVRFDVQAQVQNGQRITVEYMIAPVYDSEGKVQYLIPSGIDVTERSRLATLLAQQRTHLENILNNVPGVVYEMEGDPRDETNRHISFISKYAEEMLGYPLETWKSHPNFWSQIIVPDDYQGAVDKANQIRSEGQTATVSFRCRTQDGRILEVESYSTTIYDREGNRIGSCGVVMDITERRLAERELRRLSMLAEEQRNRLNYIIGNVPGMVYESTIDAITGKQVMDYISDYAQILLGYNPDDWAQDEDLWSRILHPDDIESIGKYVTAIYESGKPGVVPFRCFHKDGHLIHAEAYLNLVPHPDGKIVQSYGVIMDVSFRRDAEAELARYMEDLRRSNQELEQFAYVASHDLQEPLRMVNSYLQLIEQRYADKLDQDGREFIDFAVDGSTRMKTLINDLLAYSRVQRAREEFTEFDSGTIVNRVLNNLKLTIEDTGAVITCDHLPRITGNAGQITQLFQNLIGNALKFRRPGVTPTVHIGINRQGSDWLFSVCDNGIGIEADYLERIFVIFQRLHAKGKYPGTGIGLAICKKVVENHGGQIRVESVPGEGTTFYFTLPISQKKR